MVDVSIIGKSGYLSGYLSQYWGCKANVISGDEVRSRNINNLAPNIIFCIGDSSLRHQPCLKQTFDFEKHFEFQTLLNLKEHVETNNITLTNFIYFSSGAVYGYGENFQETSRVKPENLYGFLKSQCEQFITINFINSTIVRLGPVWGGLMRKHFLLSQLIDASANNNTIRLNCPKDRRNFVSIFDVTKLTRILIDNEANIGKNLGIINYGHKKPICSAQIAELFIETGLLYRSQVRVNEGNCGLPFCHNTMDMSKAYQHGIIADVGLLDQIKTGKISREILTS